MAMMIKEGLYYVGVLNPNLRVFDIVMNTEYGTSYNSYVIKDEKIALIETCHKSFFEEYLGKISKVTPLDKIDYIVLNHTEPDHSGALKELVKLAPKAKIVCSKAASIYLKGISNKELDIITVKDGDTILLGKNTMKFVNAPFLHWPDSMFTYVEGLETVFTCDFLGTHYCEPRIFDKAITYPEKYKKAMKEYYDAIFSPFKPYVLAGIKKLEELNFDTVCVSHGPILSKGALYEYVKQNYLKWSEARIKEKKSIPVFYCSAYGYTKMLAEEAYRTIRETMPDCNTGMYDIREGELCEAIALMNSSDGFMLGSPTINKDTVPLVWELLAHLDAINNQKKPVGIFGSYGWSGEAVPAIAARLSAIRLNVIGEGYKAVFCPDSKALEGMSEYTKQFIAAIK
ncbi:MAG: FprA family A-type flavoprotein [Clostridia bacterium]|nr:FprA family A-type flavoprotein [Clostridia bacterium]